MSKHLLFFDSGDNLVTATWIIVCVLVWKIKCPDGAFLPFMLAYSMKRFVLV